MVELPKVSHTWIATSLKCLAKILDYSSSSAVGQLAGIRMGRAAAASDDSTGAQCTAMTALVHSALPGKLQCKVTSAV